MRTLPRPRSCRARSPPHALEGVPDLTRRQRWKARVGMCGHHAVALLQAHGDGGGLDLDVAIAEDDLHLRPRSQSERVPKPLRDHNPASSVYVCFHGRTLPYTNPFWSLAAFDAQISQSGRGADEDVAALPRSRLRGRGSWPGSGRRPTEPSDEIAGSSRGS